MKIKSRWSVFLVKGGIGVLISIAFIYLWVVESSRPSIFDEGALIHLGVAVFVVWMSGQLLCVSLGVLGFIRDIWKENVNPIELLVAYFVFSFFIYLAFSILQFLPWSIGIVWFASILWWIQFRESILEDAETVIWASTFYLTLGVVSVCFVEFIIALNQISQNAIEML